MSSPGSPPIMVTNDVTNDADANQRGEAPARVSEADADEQVIGLDDRILITGAAGFIGSHVVQRLVDRGFRNLVCFVRPSSDIARLEAMVERCPQGTEISIFKGNLLRREDCEAGCKDVRVILHLAAGTGEKSFPDAFMNSVVSMRNLLDAGLRCGRLRRFVLVSSFAVYSNKQKSRRLDELCPIEEHPELRDAYCYAKVKQEEMIAEYARNSGVPYVIVRPGSVYGSGSFGITGRVGLGTFGLFLHLGGSNKIPFTHVENCAEAVVLAGLVKGVDGEAFNVVDDNLPSSRDFLRRYKKNVRDFRSVFVPHAFSYLLCCLWEKYSKWSYGQLPPVFTHGRWYSEWRKTYYGNEKLKRGLGWRQILSTEEALHRYFESARQAKRHD
jgi:nucleoside-diphosphate-sugar epimerase